MPASQTGHRVGRSTEPDRRRDHNHRRTDAVGGKDLAAALDAKLGDENAQQRFGLVGSPSAAIASKRIDRVDLFYSLGRIKMARFPVALEGAPTPRE